MWWDGYDGAYLNLTATELGNSPVDGDPSNSWRDPDDYLFDFFYRTQTGDIAYKDFENLSGTTFVHFFMRPNPWLTYLNSLHQVETWKEKYIFYGGYNDAQTGHWANKLEDTTWRI